jgi:hexosaminidase
MIHLGGDEVDTSCWASNPTIMAWLTARNLTTDGGYGYFVNRTAHIAAAQGRRPIQWNEVWDHFGTALPKESVVHVRIVSLISRVHLVYVTLLRL